jgi:hypothetical protein
MLTVRGNTAQRGGNRYSLTADVNAVSEDGAGVGESR